ncbi:asialoglycoprotein receptor 2-like [Patiria miniata]|uniref:C-type lectin domain-containing protein n=1 Tax=Patiria miniata TaxID=46514 RepID=A0A914B974_PATMI|nr:asialoglycoprotein receptor 2-like [Patiria miniata]
MSCFVYIFVSLALFLSSGLNLSPSCNRRHGLCTAPWKKWGGSCYLITQKPLTYDDAREACRRLGAKMAAPRSDQENDFLANLTQGSEIWVACTDRRQEGEWECEGSQDGERIYTNWIDDQPDNGGGKEHCAAIWSPDNKWNDYRCKRDLLAVCKRQPRTHCFTTNSEGRLEADSCL